MAERWSRSHKQQAPRAGRKSAARTVGGRNKLETVGDRNENRGGNEDLQRQNKLIPVAKQRRLNTQGESNRTERRSAARGRGTQAGNGRRWQNPDSKTEIDAGT
jgi:hypothetical protein